jgi:signal transduction histidine kinase
MECVGRLAGGIAHDLTNVLTIIQGHLSGARMKSRGNKEMEEPLLEIGIAADRVATLARQLLLFSSKRVIQTRKLNLKELLNNLLRLLGPLLSAGIELRLECQDDLAPVRGDQAMLEQLVLNLLLNARDAMPAGGRLTIGACGLLFSEEEAGRAPDSRAGPCVCIHVTDTGAGVSPEQIPRIFEPFFTAKDLGRGAGLGLAAVYGIVKQHRGWTQVTSQPGQGVTFRIFLPQSEEA